MIEDFYTEILSKYTGYTSNGCKNDEGKDVVLKEVEEPKQNVGEKYDESKTKEHL